MRGLKPVSAVPLPSILIVDADPDTRFLYRIVLDDFGCSIVEAEDGAEALGKAMCDPPDLIVTETRLGRIDGYALCAFLRGLPQMRATAILVVTAAAFPGDVKHAMDVGADEVLLKPCPPEILLAVADQLWQRRHPNGPDRPARSHARS